MNRTPINKLSLTSLIGLCSHIFCSTVQARRSHRVKAPLHLRLNIVCFLATICLFTASTAHSLSAQELNASDAAFDDLFGTSALAVQHIADFADPVIVGVGADIEVQLPVVVVGV